MDEQQPGPQWRVEVRVTPVTRSPDGRPVNGRPVLSESAMLFGSEAEVLGSLGGRVDGWCERQIAARRAESMAPLEGTVPDAGVASATVMP